MSLKVVIVDDDPVIRILHKTLVQKSDLDQTPTLLENGREAWHFLKDEDNIKGQKLLLLLDLQMPEINGFELLDLMKNLPNQTNVFVIMLLSSVSRADEIKASKYTSVIGYIEKPLNLQTLEQVKTLEKIRQHF